MSQPPHGRRRRAPGPLLVLLPALVLAVVLALLFRRPPTFRRLEPPEVSDPDEVVPALLGNLRAVDGGALAARLTPLHSDPARQSFEAAALQRRFELPDGEPWRLSLRWDPPSGPVGGAGSGGFLEARPDRTALGLGPVQVDDEGGRALDSLLSRAEGDAPGNATGEASVVVDPLRALFAPPAGGLQPGQTVDWILWGRAPGEGARVSGLLPPPDSPDADDFERSTGLRGPLLLEPGTASASELVVPVARLDRAAPTAGKIRGAGASEEDLGTARPADR